jgi:hypothetical protein
LILNLLQKIKSKNKKKVSSEHEEIGDRICVLNAYKRSQLLRGRASFVL